MSHTVSRTMRLLSMFLDHILSSIIVVAFSFPFYAKIFADYGKEPNQTLSSPVLTYIMLVGFVAYFCKDSFGGRSLAKRIIGHQVIDVKTGEAASPMRCMVRNIFCMLWPIEVIVVLVSPDRRLGDFVARTRVVDYSPDTVSPKRSAGAILLPFVIIYTVFASAFFIISTVFPSPFKAYSQYDATSYNEADSKALEQALMNKLEQYAEVEVKVYDISGFAGKRYIHVLLNLKVNNIDNDTFIEDAAAYVKQQVSIKYGMQGAMGMINFSYHDKYTREAKIRLF